MVLLRSVGTKFGREDFVGVVPNPENGSTKVLQKSKYGILTTEQVGFVGKDMFCQRVSAGGSGEMI